LHFFIVRVLLSLLSVATRSFYHFGELVGIKNKFGFFLNAKIGTSLYHFGAAVWGAFISA
jgi:hypothetical protein